MNPYQELFEYMLDEHGVTLLESDMQEIVRICERISSEELKEETINTENETPTFGNVLLSVRFGLFC
jgi:hypothetical protein